MTEQNTLKQFIENKCLFEKKRKKKRKKKSSTRRVGGIANSWYLGGASNMGHNGDNSGDGGGMGESLIVELLSGISGGSFSANMRTGPAMSKQSNNPEAGMTTHASADPGDWEWAEEEIETKNKSKKEMARSIFIQKYKTASRAEVIDAISRGTGIVTHTADTYYSAFLNEFGLDDKEDSSTNPMAEPDGSNTIDSEMNDDHNELNDDQSADGVESPETEFDQSVDGVESPETEFEDPDRAGVIRVVAKAHLVYKRQTEEGNFEELWIYNIHTQTNDELDIRRDILAGTDIPKNKTKSPDGAQNYTVITMGNAQMLRVRGLSN